MEMNVDELVKLSEAWLPVVLEYSGKLTLAVITLLVGWWLISRLTSSIGRMLEARKVDRALSSFISSLVSIVLRILLLISVASMIGVETTSFIAMIGAAGLAIGLALQGSLANFAGGVLIMLFRPFRAGDWIEAQGVSGSVDSIQIFHTTLKTADNKVVIVPNGALSNGHITNYCASRVGVPTSISVSITPATSKSARGAAGNCPRPTRACRAGAGGIRHWAG